LTDKSRREKINEVLESEEGIAMAGKVLLTVSKDEVERARLLSELKYELDTQSRLANAERRGKKEGLQAAEEKYRPLIEEKDQKIEEKDREIEELRRRLREAGMVHPCLRQSLKHGMLNSPKQSKFNRKGGNP
jgi:flagellar biosynthesis/type III secretory pathway protein FliH